MKEKVQTKTFFYGIFHSQKIAIFFFISQLEKFTVSRPLMKTLLNDPAS